MYNRTSLFNTVDTNNPPWVTLIIAPSGYGKTATTKQYIEYLNLPYVWNTLDQWSAYENVFAGTTQSLFAEYYPSIEKQLTPEINPTQLAQQVRVRGAPIVYVIDNCHHLNSNPLTIAWLDKLISESQGACFFVLVGQKQPSIELIDILATRSYHTITEHNLRLTSQDALQLAAQFNHNPKIVETLIANNEGWIAGIVPWLNRQKLDEPDIFDTSQFSLDHYIENTLSKLDTPTRLFIYQSVIPEQFSKQQLIDIFKLLDVDNRLAFIQDAYSLMTRLENGKYQYHEATRRIILQHLSKDSHQYQTLNNLYAQWYEKNELFDVAIYHYLEAKQIPEARRIMNYIIDTYKRHGFTDILLNLEKLFKQHHICIPSLQLICSAIYNSQLLFNKAVEALDYIETTLIDIDHQLYIKIQIERAYIKIRQREFNSAITTLLNLKKEVNLNSEKYQFSLAQIEHMLGQTFLELGNFQQAEIALLVAKDIYLAMNYQRDVATVLQDLALVYTRSGQLQKVGQPLLHMFKIRKELDNPRDLTHACNNIGSYYIQCHDYQSGEHYFIDGLRYSEKANDRRIQGYLYWNLGDLYRDLKDYENAFANYTQALNLSIHDKQVQYGVLASFARFYTFNNQKEKAYEIWESVKDGAQNLNFSLFVATAELNLLLLIRGNDYQVHSAFMKVLELGNQIEITRAIGPTLEHAIITQNQSLIDTVTELILKQIETQQSLQPFIVYLTYSNILFDYMNEHVEIFFELIELAHQLKNRQHSIAINVSQKGGSGSNITISLTTFKVESIKLEQHKLDYSDFPNHTQRELLYWLYFIGPKRGEEIKLHFWRDHTSAKAKSALATMKYRLNQILGEVILYEDGWYQINPTFKIISDAHRFEKISQETRVSPIDDIRTEDLLLKALELYNGDFLIEFDANWIAILRDKYHQYFIDILIRLSQCALNRGDESAIAYAQWAIRENDFNELAYLQLIDVFAKLNRVDNAIQTYQSLETHLMTELGVSISQDSRLRFESIIRNR